MSDPAWGERKTRFLVIAAPRPSGLPDLDLSRQDLPGGVFLAYGRAHLLWRPKLTGSDESSMLMRGFEQRAGASRNNG
jgi:hypothetical protein